MDVEREGSEIQGKFYEDRKFKVTLGSIHDCLKGKTKVLLVFINLEPVKYQRVEKDRMR